jgi:hypothetical protein
MTQSTTKYNLAVQPRTRGTFDPAASTRVADMEVAKFVAANYGEPVAVWAWVAGGAPFPLRWL